MKFKKIIQKSGCSNVYIDRSQIMIPNNSVFLSLKIALVYANIVDPNEKLYYAAFHLSLYCLPNNTFRGH